jgi:hypothetical protein
MAKENAAVGRSIQTRQATQKRGFARARFADDAKNFTRPQRKGYVTTTDARSIKTTHRFSDEQWLIV